MLVIRFVLSVDVVSSCKAVSGGVFFSYLCVGHVESTVRVES